MAPVRARARRPKPKAEATRSLPGREGADALALAAEARIRGPGGLVLVATSESRCDRLARLLWAMAPDLETFPFPPWDCLPYDRNPPSARTMGLRIAALSALATPRARPWILLVTPEALLQRLPPRSVWEAASLRLRTGDTVDVEDLARALVRIGYVEDDRIDEPGEFAIRGRVVDVFPSGYGLPVRIDHEAGRLGAIASFHPATQRTTDAFDTLALRPVSEAILPEAADGDRPGGIEHRLPELYPTLETLFDYAQEAAFWIEPGTGERGEAFVEGIADCYESRLGQRTAEARPVAPDRMYLTNGERDALLARREVTRLDEPPNDAAKVIPSLRTAPALKSYLATEAEAGRRLAVAGRSDEDLRAAAARITRASGQAPRRVQTWAEVEKAAQGEVVALPLDLPGGFVSPDGAVAAVTAAEILGVRAAGDQGRRAAEIFGDEQYRIGDAVIHLDHGVGRLAGLETITAGPEAPAADTVRIEYAGGSTLMVPVSELDLMWRYGGPDAKVTPDRLGGQSWPKRRAKVEAEITQAAGGLATLAADRRARTVPKLQPPRAAYERFVARFPFGETPDQALAVEAILADLASGHPMDRLVCGDVGFGKTEVALRAAAAVALSGRQVAIVAPTTVLVRQHLQTFGRRFADLGIEIGHLSRLVKPAEARRVKAGLADGSVRIAIGTHALAGKGVSFADLGLLVVDEEQRFGAADKRTLRALGPDAHVLTLTATPIPRTLQSALVGLQEVSVLATPPAERLPVRTFVGPFDEPTIRQALTRERRRGGQSFVVCPRIADIEPMAERLRRLVPELSLVVAHGQLPADAIDAAMVGFADGEGDVLLATNIIESGLDVPRANTIVVWRADTFGLAQLHQLRGRVGRGRTRGIAYLATDPDAEVAEAMVKRLRTLEQLDRLGAGFAISAEDMEARGAGDLLGESQAGHTKLIGAGLYRRLLERALHAARGEPAVDDWIPELNLGLSGLIPADYVPEAEVRLNLYGRLARSTDEAQDAALAEEMEDRFGLPPEGVRNLLALARLKRNARAAGAARIDAGPQAIALTFKERGEADEVIDAAIAASGGKLGWSGRRLVLSYATEDPERRLAALESLLEAVTPPAAGRPGAN